MNSYDGSYKRSLSYNYQQNKMQSMLENNKLYNKRYPLRVNISQKHLKHEYSLLKFFMICRLKFLFTLF